MTQREACPSVTLKQVSKSSGGSFTSPKLLQLLVKYGNVHCRLCLRHLLRVCIYYQAHPIGPAVTRSSSFR